MQSYTIGNRYPEFIGQPDGMRFDITDSGAILTVTFKSPTENEVAQFDPSERFEIRFVQLYDIIMVTAKFGDIPWMNMPYTPHLSRNLTGVNVPEDDEGLMLQIFLFDTATGELKKIRVVGLGNRFTKNLFKAVLEVKAKSFDFGVYNRAVDAIYAAHTTNQLVKMSRDYFKMN